MILRLGFFLVSWIFFSLSWLEAGRPDDWLVVFFFLDAGIGWVSLFFSLYFVSRFKPSIDYTQACTVRSKRCGNISAQTVW